MSNHFSILFSSFEHLTLIRARLSTMCPGSFSPAAASTRRGSASIASRWIVLEASFFKLTHLSRAASLCCGRALMFFVLFSVEMTLVAGEAAAINQDAVAQIKRQLTTVPNVESIVVYQSPNSSPIQEAKTPSGPFIQRLSSTNLGYVYGYESGYFYSKHLQSFLFGGMLKLTNMPAIGRSPEESWFLTDERLSIAPTGEPPTSGSRAIAEKELERVLFVLRYGIREAGTNPIAVLHDNSFKFTGKNLTEYSGRLICNPGQMPSGLEYQSKQDGSWTKLAYYDWKEREGLYFPSKFIAQRERHTNVFLTNWIADWKLGNAEERVRLCSFKSYLGGTQQVNRIDLWEKGVGSKITAQGKKLLSNEPPNYDRALRKESSGLGAGLLIISVLAAFAVSFRAYRKRQYMSGTNNSKTQRK